MKILVTGATGLIGKELVKLLLSRQHTVHYLTTSKSKIENKPNYQGFYWNPQLGKIDDNCIYEVDIIIHLAGANIAKCWTNSYKQEIIESRILSSELLYNLVKKHPNQVKQIISASGTAIYPESHIKTYDETITETDDGFLSHVVRKWEESVDRFQVLGLKVCKLRTGMVLSNAGGALPKMIKPLKIGLGAAIGNGKQIQSWIHINDLVRIYCFVMENQLEGVFNAVAPNVVSNQELTKVIARALKKPLFLPNVPQFTMKLLLGEMSSLLFSSKNLSSQKIINEGYRFKFPGIEEAIADLYP
ncbi:MAG TPA: TIGR01777 family oxidoreductase [Flavobacterium sp.]|uniref:TIGR01777 family oxidoreductase n=1 Tax=Flavobacterium sp. TaxID=239 RepID=UPI002C46B905|nr:TIGR01777 family oxidoreductase [Flavobacterium sp.]HNP33832.1 TIGR01777 family oxidoreductase [Flavobacterium sp.]